MNTSLAGLQTDQLSINFLVGQETVNAECNHVQVKYLQLI